MKHRRLVLLVLLVLVGHVTASCAADVPTTGTSTVALNTEDPMSDGNRDRELDEFLAQIDVATNQMVNGESELWERLYSHAPDATLFGGWGGPGEKGWDQLSARWRMVTSRFRTGTMTIEPITKHVSGDLAVTVQLVRGQATFSDGSAGNVALRVTHVLRREAGGWRIVHRHADEQMKLLPISSHIQPSD